MASRFEWQTKLIRFLVVVSALAYLPSATYAQDDDYGDMPPEEVYEGDPNSQPLDEPPFDEPPPEEIEPPFESEEPMDEPPPRQIAPPQNEPPDHGDQDPPPEEPPMDDPSLGPRPDPNYGKNTGNDGPATAVETEESKNRQVIRTVPRKEYTKQEISAFCQTYNGKFISFYSDVYKVDQCKRRKVEDANTIYQLTRKGVSIENVSQDVIAAIPEGTPFELAEDKRSARSCKSFNGSYVTYSNVDVYYVQDCKKQLMPDWETYLAHRNKRQAKKNAPIESLSWVEFQSIPDGKAVPSVLDEAYADVLSGNAGVDVIPVDEACEGVNNRAATYYSRLYRIEGCKKREIIDPSRFLKDHQDQKIVELTSEQWLSLPDGVPIENKAKMDPKAAGNAEL